MAVLLACLTAVILSATAADIGLTWDEPVYMVGAESYASWFDQLVKNPARAVKPETIDQYWIVNHEHPPFDRILSGLIWQPARQVLDDLTARRLGNILLVAVMVGLLYKMIADTFGVSAGLFSVLALLSMPRFFFHAHLAALDMPVAVGIFVVTYIFWITLDRKGWGWGIVLGVAFGLAEAIKLNATFMPVALVIWFLIFRRRWSIVLRLFLMGLVGILVFVAVWPWLYTHTWSRIVEYVLFHVDHFKIGQWYFGHFYQPPPWHFVFVMLWAVVPLTIFLLAILGMMRAGRGRSDHGLVWLLIISALVSIAPFAIGQSLLYDNERLFMPVFPFLAGLAGVGFGWLGKKLAGWLQKLGKPAWIVPSNLVLAILMILPQTIGMAGLYPHLLSYYSEGVGGLRGATALGLESTYWCETYASALPYINAHAEPGDRIWVEPWSYDILIYYQTIGKLRSDVRILNEYPADSVFRPYVTSPVVGTYLQADWWIFQSRQSQYGWYGQSYPILLFLEKKTPVLEVNYQGVPLMRLYHRD